MNSFFSITSYSTSAEGKFGLCENANNLHTYIEEGNESFWLSTVLNPDESEKRYIPVKNCLRIDPAFDDMVDLCSGVLIFTDNLVFTELKNTHFDFQTWVQSGADHLKNTIKIFKNNHNIDDYQFRVAYLAYKTKRRVPISNNALKNKFASETGMKLYISHEIDV
jgi:hypothetical protein